MSLCVRAQYLPPSRRVAKGNTGKMPKFECVRPRPSTVLLLVPLDTNSNTFLSSRSFSRSQNSETELKIQLLQFNRPSHDMFENNSNFCWYASDLTAKQSDKLRTKLCRSERWHNICVEEDNNDKCYTFLLLWFVTVDLLQTGVDKKQRKFNRLGLTKNLT